MPELIKLQQARVELAMALQRQIRPAELPEVPGLRTAACNVPARAGLDVGGDWYDAITMSGETVGIAIGDVAGHDVQGHDVTGHCDNAAVVVISHDGNPGPASSAGGDDVAPFPRSGG